LYRLTNTDDLNNASTSNQNYIELTDFRQNVLMNTESVINKSNLISSNGLLNVDLDKLYKEYYNGDFNEYSMFKLEKLYNDFRIVLKLTDSFKNNYLNSNSSKKLKNDVNNTNTTTVINTNTTSTRNGHSKSKLIDI
jgi:hypothetical protein